MKESIALKRITRTDSAGYAFVEQLLTQAFPSEEYRELGEFRRYVAEKEAFHCNLISLQNLEAINEETDAETAFIGLLTYWDFGTYCYLEHFAIDPAKRNGGIGAMTLNCLKQTLQKPLVFEVEEPNEEMARRRIGFYERQGFRLWKDSEYYQPPYKKGDGFLRMYLMADEELNETNDFEMIKQQIYREVYGQ